MSSSVRMSAVVVAYASREELPASIGTLFAVPGLQEVVVVDHGHDGSADVAIALGATVVRDPTNPGYGAGQNRGVAQTTGEYLLLVNPDAVVSPTGISTGIALLDAEPDVAAVQGVIRNRGTGQPERSQGVELGSAHLLGRALGLRRLLRFGFVRQLVRRAPGIADHVERVPNAPAEVQALAATALLVRREAFDQVGGFDEGFFLYGEDADLCRRLRMAGWRLMSLPVEWAEHGSGASSVGWWNRELVWWEGTLGYAARWWQPRAWFLARLATLIRALPMAVVAPRRLPELVSRLFVNPGTVRRGPHRRPG